MNSPEVPQEDLPTLPLHTITEKYGTSGLLERFDIEMQTLDEPSQEQLEKALSFVSELHLKDTRSTEPYLNHLLRVCMRLKIYYKIEDVDILVAALLHDSVEDHAQDIIGADLGSEEKNKEAALEIISQLFNTNVSELVRDVTNPEFDDDRDIMEIEYLEHLEDLTENGKPGSVLIKLSDFTDNATGIHYSRGPKLAKWANKYKPIVPILRYAILRNDLPISDEVREHIEKQLALTEERLDEVLAST